MKSCFTYYFIITGSFLSDYFLIYHYSLVILMLYIITKQHKTISKLDGWNTNMKYLKEAITSRVKTKESLTKTEVS